MATQVGLRIMKITFILTIFIQSGITLRCWTCSSDLDVSCLDHFNTTKILQQRSYYQNVNINSQYQRNDMPSLIECSNNMGVLYGQKQVCMKKILSVPNGRQIVSRECKGVSNQQATGTCPDEPIARGSSRVFCEYCDIDGCNSATGLTMNVALATLIPISLLYLFHK